MHDRLLFIFQNLVGYNVSVQLKDGTVYEGIFHTAHVERQEVSIVLQMAILIHEGGGGPPDPNKPRPRLVPTKSVVLQAKDFVQVTAKDVALFNQVGGSSSAGSDLVTDSSLGSRQKGAGKVGRELVAWQPDEDDGAVALEDSLVSMPPPGRGGGGGRNEAWDQFRVNSESFGVQSTFDENLYTTRLDVGEGGISEQEAERIAREIEQSSTSNPHVAEERGQVVGLDENMDEEDRFSSVVRADASKETFDSRNDATFGDEDSSEAPKDAWSSGPPSMVSQERAASVASGSRGSAESQEAQSREHVRLRLHMGAGAQTKGKPAAGQPSFLPSSKWAPVGGVQVGNADQLQALNLDTARVEVPEEVYRDFHAFKDKQYQESAGGARQPARVEQTQRMRAFSQEMQLREGVAASAGQPPASGEPKQEYDVKWVGKTPADAMSPTASGASAAQKPAAVPAPASPTAKPPPQPPTSAAPTSTSEAPKEEKKSTFTFNINAKPFTLNVNAKEFTPTFTPAAPAVPRPAAPAPAQPPPVTHVPFVMQPTMPPQPHMYGGVPGQPMMQYAVAQTAYIPGHAYQVPGQHGQPRPPYRHGQQQVVSQYPPAVHVAQPPQYPPGTVLVGTPPVGPGMHPAAARPQAHMHAAPPPGTPVVMAPPMPPPPVEDGEQPPPPSI
ncbi:Polyadenylate-binding protein-interacting protein 3 [Cymbomonas tetramitiformis]|uniref:Polyadenylate-binding protein-interacting protein 3 n=1 Tax=Cymbomonas tetramitiformis TaxID=36881 RepID=A0AAE0L4G1_9CHLO|nr:Polyadenylate-binding protein-interacting protein 3 [Cymbomonas tetramitiformis]